MADRIFFILPLLCAFTAWGTAYLLIYGILYPLQPIRIGGITIQGFLPARLQAKPHSIAVALAKEIVDNLQPDNLAVDTAALRPTIEAHLDTYLRVRLREKMPVIASFIGDSTLLKLKESMIEEIDTLLPQVMATYISTSLTKATVYVKVLPIIRGITGTKLEEVAGPALQKARRRVPLMFALAGLCMGAIFATIIYCLF